MDSQWPTLEELNGLPMRAVVACAAATARRLSSMLRGVIADAIIDDVLESVDAVLQANKINEVKKDYLANALCHLADAYAAASSDMKSPAKFLMVFCVIHATFAAISLIEAATDPSSADHQMEIAVREAHRAIRAIGSIDNAAVRASATQAARQDYEMLLSVYGKHDEVVIGSPVSCLKAGR